MCDGSDDNSSGEATSTGIRKPDGKGKRRMVITSDDSESCLDSSPEMRRGRSRVEVSISHFLSYDPIDYIRYEIGIP